MDDSGDTWSTTVPKLVPLMRASEMRTQSLTPRSSSTLGMGMWPHSGKPGAPFGPQPFITRTVSLSTGRSMQSMESCICW